MAVDALMTLPATAPLSTETLWAPAAPDMSSAAAAISAVHPLDMTSSRLGSRRAGRLPRSVHCAWSFETNATCHDTGERMVPVTTVCFTAGFVRGQAGDAAAISSVKVTLY
jgi:hypothetical protein